MASTPYPYVKAVDGFRLEQEILDSVDITVALESISGNATNVTVRMADALSGPEETALDALVAAHINTPWEDPEIPNQYEAASTTEHQTTNPDYDDMEGMTLTPAAGTYTVTFSGSGEMSNNNKKAYYAIYVDGAVVAHSVRRKDNKKTESLFTQAEVTVDGTEVVDIRFKVSDGSFKVYERTLTLRRTI